MWTIEEDAHAGAAVTLIVEVCLDRNLSRRTGLCSVGQSHAVAVEECEKVPLQAAPGIDAILQPGKLVIVIPRCGRWEQRRFSKCHQVITDQMAIEQTVFAL